MLRLLFCTPNRPLVCPCSRRNFSNILIDKYPLVSVNEEVKIALKNRFPVVALESTIITHGMPYPENVKMARKVEQIVRDNGAVPATIAIIDGICKVGLSTAELERLASPELAHQVKKVSRRDLAYVTTIKANGGTTVAATMILANIAGINFFATGGIGGVHRGAEVSMDVSADLPELGKTPVCVVCAGIKSILDIPKSLEVLETQGVPVAVVGSDEFPSFFTNKSGIKAPLRIDQPATLAKMHYISKSMGLTNGMVVAVPNPVPTDSDTIQDAVNQALKEADMKGVSGNEITPFLLNRVKELTQGKSLDSNISLVFNNAKVAAQIAVAYSFLVAAASNGEAEASPKNISLVQTSSSFSSSSSTGKVQLLTSVPVMIFGGAVVDVVATSRVYLIRGSSNPGVMKQSFGGVGRNIAEGLTRLGKSPSLISAIADDDNGKALLSQLSDLQVVTSMMKVVPTSEKVLSPLSAEELQLGKHPISVSHSTAHYIAIHDSNGDLFAGIADMDIFKHIDKKYVQSVAGNIRTSRLVVIDGNASSEAFAEVLRVSHSYSIPVFFEPTSDHKCVLPIATNTIQMIDVIKPNLSELVTMIDAIAQRDGLREGKSSVESALRNVKAAISGGLITGTVVNTIDVKTLACALRRVMISGIQLHGLPAQQKLAADTTSSVKSTSEGLARKIKGKHVIVSMGKSGVLWCADKDIVSRTGRDNIPVQTSGRQVSPSFIVVDDSTAIKLFPPSTIPLPQGQTSLTPEQAQRLNTNGAGDAFCAGVISSLFDESCKELDSTCINAGLDAAANQIARSIS